MIFLLALALAAATFQLLALYACLQHLRTPRKPVPPALPGVSILKPVRGADETFWEAIRSHAAIDYPEFEILFGVRDPNDPALTAIERLRQQFPDVTIRVVRVTTEAPNGKVGSLEDLGRAARYPVWVVNDSDITVPPHYLRHLTAELSAPGIGLVTCLYRATARTFAGTVESIGIATDFTPGALVAPLVGVREFGLGSTLAFRRETLAAAGGFAAVREYIADDYGIGRIIHASGKRVVLSAMPVATHLEGNWRDVWRHQVRWARTIRVSRGGYYGLPITNATCVALLVAAAGWPGPGGALFGLRLLTAIVSGALVLQDRSVIRNLWLVPFRDLFGLAVWFAGCFGTTVHWRGEVIQLSRDGRIVR